MDLSTLSPTELNDIARLLNGRRETLGWYTPKEAMACEMKKFEREHRAGAALPGGYSKGAVLNPWQPAKPLPEPRSAQ